MPSNPAKEEYAKLAEEVAECDSERATVVVSELASRIDAPDLDGVLRLIDALRRRSFHGAVAMLAAHALRGGADSALIAHRYAQAKLETGDEDGAREIALRLVEALKAGALFADVRRHADREYRMSEALGLLGRIFKQRYLRSHDEGSASRSAWDEALAYYSLGYDLDPSWHGANVVALLRRGADDGFVGESQSRAWAEKVLSEFDRTPEDRRNAWAYAGAGESALALGPAGDKTARNLYAMFAAKADRFELAIAARQLRDVWGGLAGPAGANIRALLVARAFAKGRAGTAGAAQPFALEDDVGELCAEVGRTGEETLEALLGSDRTTTIQTLEALLRCSGSVCRVVDRRIFEARGVHVGGTGFVVDGGAFGGRFRGRRLLLTAGHVLRSPTASAAEGVEPANALAVFERPGGRRQRQCVEIKRVVAWESKDERDFAISLLSEPTSDIPALDVESSETEGGRLLAAASGRRGIVYVVGHPMGRGLEFSISDNAVVDHDLTGPARRPYRRIHYRAPTEKGSSGGPVLEPHTFKVVGLHRRGGSTIERLREGETPSTYAANEAVWIGSVLAALANVAEGDTGA